MSNPMPITKGMTPGGIPTVDGTKVKPAIYNPLPDGTGARHRVLSAQHQERIPEDYPNMGPAFNHGAATASDGTFPGHTCRAEAAVNKWYEARGCSHAHCPEGCEHPQPFLDAADPNRLLCGRCWFVYGKKETEMVPCVEGEDGNC